MLALELFLLVVGGFVAAVCNTVAGGGSMLTLPLLVFSGLSPNVANGTNRIFMLVQSFTGTAALYREGRPGENGLRSLFAIIPGAVIGSYVASIFPPEKLKTVFAVIILCALAFSFIKKRRKKTETVLKSYPLPLIFLTFLALGFYGGFIQAGLGGILFFAYTGMLRLSAISAMTTKNFVIALYTAPALAVFALQDQVSLPHGIALSAGAVLGSLTAARIATKIPVRAINIFVAVTMLVSSLYLLIF